MPWRAVAGAGQTAPDRFFAVFRRAGRNFLFLRRGRRYVRRVRSFVATVVMLSRSILGDTRVRRQWMFLGTLMVLGFVFGGYFLASGFLRAHPFVFALYILASLAGVVFLVLFALYDMLVIRREFQEARRAAHEEMMRDVRRDREEGVGE